MFKSDTSIAMIYGIFPPCRFSENYCSSNGYDRKGLFEIAIFYPSCKNLILMHLAVRSFISINMSFKQTPVKLKSPVCLPVEKHDIFIETKSFYSSLKWV